MPLDQVHVGDRLRVRPGEKVPVDGVVIEGTDERRRVDDHRRTDAGREKRGDKVIGGTVNSTGSFRDGGRARRQRHVLAQIVRDGRRGPAQPRADPGLADKVAGYFVPAVLGDRDC